MEQIAAQKRSLRKELREKRKQIDRQQLLTDSAALCERLLALPELQKANTVFCYVSYGGEVETHRLIRQLFSDGKQVAVPRCGKNGVMDAVIISSFSDLHPGMMGILEPSFDAPAIPAEWIDFAVIPAVACGADSSRLGQGGGYYDRFLEKASCPFAAVCLEEYLLPALPCEGHDQYMKIIVTQQRVLRFEEI